MWERAQEAGATIFPLKVPLLKKGAKGASDVVKLAGSLLGARRPLAAAVRDFAPDVIHVNGGRVLLQVIFAANGRPLIFHLHSAYDHLGTRLLVRLALRFSAVKLVLAPSDFMANWASVGLGGDSARIRMVHNWVDDEFFEARARNLAHELGWPSDKPVVGVVGRITPEKGQQLATEAALLLRDAGTKFGLLIAGPIDTAAGGQSYFSRMKAAAAPMDEDFRYLGPVDEVAPLLAGLSVALVLSVFEESFGLAAAEAMAAGIPVVVSPNGALPEVVGDAGVVTKECTAEAFAAAMAGLLADPSRCKALARAARKRASVFFSYTKQTDNILAILEEVASGER